MFDSKLNLSSIEEIGDDQMCQYLSSKDNSLTADNAGLESAYYENHYTIEFNVTSSDGDALLFGPTLMRQNTSKEPNPSLTLDLL